MPKIDVKKLKAAIPIEEYYQSELGPPAKTTNKHWVFLCPFHDDAKTPNLAVYHEGNYKCFACPAKGGDVLAFHQQRHGLSFPETLTALAKRYAPELTPSKANDQPQRIVAEYSYNDGFGDLLYQTVRYGPKKDFKYRRPDGNGGWIWNLQGVERVPYRFRELLKAEGIIYLPGGEKDVNTLVSHGFEATTNPCGEGNWLPEFNQYLQGQNVVVLEDNDPKGQEHGKVVSQNLYQGVKFIKIIRFPDLPEHGDVSDYLENHSREEFLKLVKDAPVFEGDYAAYFNEDPSIQSIPNKVTTTPLALNIENNGDETGHQKTVGEFMKDAGIDALKEDSTPEETSAAVIKFSNLTISLNLVLRKAAQGNLIKKLKDAGVVGAGEIVRQAFKVDSEKKEDKDQYISLEDPIPWENEVTGAELLEEITDNLRLYTVLPEGGETAIALWILFAWTHDCFFISPYLVFNSPTKRCGKTTALSIISKLVPRPMMSANISTAGFFRIIDRSHPTLILDELDTFINNNPEIGGIINAGHERDGAYVLRLEGDDFIPKPFSVWGPKVFAGIGRRKDTLEDRSVIIPMKRKSPNQKVKKIKRDRLEDFKIFRRKAARWAEDYAEILETHQPTVPESLNDRAQDNWSQLMAIAEIAGGEWPHKAKDAALILSGDSEQDDDSIPSQLLTDIRSIFDAQSVDRISSEGLVKELVEMEDRPWPEYRKGKPISKTGVARVLKPFGIKPKTIRLEGGRTQKGYLSEQFKETFSNYLPAGGVPSVTPYTSLKSKELFDLPTVTQNKIVTDENDKNSFKNNNVSLVTDENRDIGAKKESASNEEDI